MVQYRHDTNVIISRERPDLVQFSRLPRPRGMLGDGGREWGGVRLEQVPGVKTQV